MGNKSTKEDPRPVGEVDLRDFKLRQVIGKGAFGKVKLVELRTTKQKYALKYINKLQCIEKKQVYHMFDERMLLENLEHPFIVNLRFAFQDDENMFMVIDVALGGDLRYHLLRLGTFPEDTLRIYAAEVGLALEYLHNLRIMHRDLKPDNLLLDEKGHIYVTDFNIAFKIKDKLPTSQSGSMAYMAPEMFTKTPYDTCVDWWALGVVLYECTYGVRPFRETEDTSLVEAITRVEPKFIPGPPEHVLRIQAAKKRSKKSKPLPEWHESKDRNDFLQSLLVKDVTQRLGSGPNGFQDQIMKHSWFKDLDWELVKQKKASPSFVPDPNNANFEATHEIEEVIMNDMKTLQYKPRKKKGAESAKATSKKKKSVDPEVVAIEKALDYIDEHFLPYNKELQIGRLEVSALVAAPDHNAAALSKLSQSNASTSGNPNASTSGNPNPENHVDNASVSPEQTPQAQAEKEQIVAEITQTTNLNSIPQRSISVSTTPLVPALSSENTPKFITSLAGKDGDRMGLDTIPRSISAVTELPLESNKATIEAVNSSIELITRPMITDSPSSEIRAG
ncbi:hypothetical protein RTP6_007150 [Batrachochytrium dendrobatidis]